MPEVGQPHTQSIDPRLAACMPQDGVIAQYIRWAYRTTHAPPQFHLAAILPCVAFEIARRGLAWGTTRGQRRNKPHIWTGLVAGSSVGKSTVVTEAQDFITEAYDEILGKDRYKNPWVQTDGSPAGLRQTLIDQHFDFNTEQTLAILWHDEVARILRWEDGATAFCKFYDGRDYDSHLRHLQKEGQSGRLRSPTLCAIFGGTPSSIERFTTSEHIEGGLFPRIVWFRGSVPADKRMLTRPEFPEVRTRTLAYWLEWFKAINGIALLAPNGMIEMPQEALEVVRDELFEKHKEEFALEDRLEGVRHRLLNNHVYVIAVAYAFSQGRLVVSADDMQRAVRLTLWAMESAERVTESLAVVEDVRLRVQVLHIVRESGATGVTVRDIYRAVSSRLRDYRALKSVLELLLETREIYRTKLPSSTRPRKVYLARDFVTIDPKLGDSDDPDDPDDADDPE